MDNREKAYAYAKDKKWAKAEKMLLQYIKSSKNINDLHFAYNDIIDYSYKQRKDDEDAIDRCLSYCIEDIKLLPKFKAFWNKEFNDFDSLRIPSIDRSIHILKHNRNYELLNKLLRKIIDIYNGTDKADYYQKELEKIGDMHVDEEIKSSLNDNKNKRINEQDVTLPLEDIESQFNNGEWSCTISFKKSKSKNFPQALQLAKMAPNYNEYKQGSDIIYQAIYGSHPQQYLDMLSLWDVVGNWKSSFMNINGEIVDKGTFAKVNRCYGDKCRDNKKGFCYGVSLYTENPLGCHRTKIHESRDPWYKFGVVDNKGIFHLDKKWLKKEAVRRLIPYRYCPDLDINKIINNIERLPDEVNPANEEGWEYTTYLNTETDKEYKGIAREREANFRINVNIDIDSIQEKKKARVWPWFLSGVILVFSPIWFVGLGCFGYGFYKTWKRT